MFWMTIYFISAYLLVAILLFCLRRTRHRFGPSQRIGLVSVLLLPLLPYIVVACQTIIYKRAMTPDVQQALMDTGLSDGNFTLLRILLITPTRTNVYVEEPCSAWPKVHPGDKTANVLHLRRVAGKWKLVDADAVWSDCGSATGNTFPPYASANEF